VILFKLLTYAVLVYVGLTLLLALMQSKIIFPASKDVFRDPSHYGWAFETVWLDVAGERTHAWFVPIENARGVALFSHGNAGNIANRLESIGLLHDLGLSVFVYDYGGYGESTGKPSEARCYADARAAYRHLTEERGIPPERILLFGRSLGGAVSIDLATEVPAAALVAESSFLSIEAMARATYPYLPVGLFLRHHFNNAEKIDKVRIPVLVIHSPEDEIVPYAHGQELFTRANEPKTFLDIQGGHNDGFIQSFTAYKKGWEDFLDPILPRPEIDE
jgi:fermentation-respiration switch protein FrsA (DUF1100 family)